MYPINMVCFRYIIVSTLHKGDNKGDDIIIIIVIMGIDYKYILLDLSSSSSSSVAEVLNCL